MNEVAWLANASKHRSQDLGTFVSQAAQKSLYPVDISVAASAVAMESSCGRQRRACSKANSTLLPAARVMTEKRSGKVSTILRVLFPMEPVEPRIAICFILFWAKSVL